MHEFALAQDIIETIGRHVNENMPKLAVIHIEVGVFSSVVVESLEFGLKLFLKEKNLEDVAIEFSTAEGMARCECDTEYAVNDISDCCPKCFSFNRTFTAGKDVIIKSIELRD